MHIRISRILAILIVAAFLASTANTAFFDKTAAVYPWEQNAAFLISLWLFSAAMITLLLSLFSLVFPLRGVLITALLVSAFTSYFSDLFGVIFNDEMIRNALETNVDEAAGLFSLELLARIAVMGILPAALLWRLFDISPVSRRRAFFSSLGSGVASIAVLVVCILAFGDHYGSFFRQHKSLRYYANPTYPVYSLGRFVADHIRDLNPKPFQSLHAEAAIPEQGDKRDLVILVVGETARADHFSLNGYGRDTNPHLEALQNVVSFGHVSSCGTSTAISVPCMFAESPRSDFDVDTARNTENVLDVLQAAGVHVLWRDNNSDSKGVADRIPYENFRTPETNPSCDEECRDIGMLTGLQRAIDSQRGDILIVLHQMGSHGPAYYQRYPKEFERWTPVCTTAELAECSDEEITNAYDNSILYTDYFLSQVIEFLKSNSQKFETSMLYMSDHGESLGEGGLYLHGLPYMIAPDAQTKVPFITWGGASSDIDPARTSLLSGNTNSQDALFGTLLELFEVETELQLSYEPLIIRRESENEI